MAVMGRPALRTIYVYQDGTDFYISLKSADDENRDTLTAPFEVKDSNMAAAMLARTWFMSECRQNNFSPIFHDEQPEHDCEDAKNGAEPNRFVNFYRCDDCGEEWQDRWACQVDDDCPSCGKSISPHESEDI